MDQSSKPKPKPKRRQPKQLSHTRRMACFERCVEIQSKSERNSLRRRARLLKAIHDLGLQKYINRAEISERVLQAKDRQHGNHYQGLSAADRLGMKWPEVEWLIPNLLPARDLNIIGGRPKVGKTVFAMAIGAATLKGQPVAGLNAPNTTRPVIVVSDDQGDADTKQAMDQLGIFDHPQLIWSRRFRLTESDLDRLLADVRRNPGALVIIDSLRSVSRGLEQAENDPEIGAVIYDLKAAVMDAGGSVLLVHHCNKAAGFVGVEALSGHNAIAGAANTVVTLHYVENAKGLPDKEAEQRRMVREGRTGKPLDWVISRTPGTATFHKVGTWASWQEQIELAQTETKRKTRQTNTQRDVLEKLQQYVGEWLTCRKVVEALGLEWGTGNGKDPNRVREALNALERNGQIKRVRTGQQYTYSTGGEADQPSHGTQLVSSTSKASAALPCNGIQSRGQISTASIAPQPAKGSEVVEVWPQLQNTMQGKDSDAVAPVEAISHPVSVLQPLLADLPAAMIGSGADAFDDEDDPTWAPRPNAMSCL
jgi:Fe2+ or Zn2+ uptake regulation protein